jgi:hypothetical protein
MMQHFAPDPAIFRKFDAAAQTSLAVTSYRVARDRWFRAEGRTPQSIWTPGNSFIGGASVVITSAPHMMPS